MTQEVSVETGLEQAAASVEATPAPEQTTTAVGGAEVAMVNIPKGVYEEAVEDNRQRKFTLSILEARTPTIVAPYVPPPVPEGIALQTQAEMEAGRKRVSEFEANEAVRRQVAEAHKNDRWADKKSTAVFRPGDFVPNQRKGQGNLGGRAAAV